MLKISVGSQKLSLSIEAITMEDARFSKDTRVQILCDGLGKIRY